MPCYGRGNPNVELCCNVKNEFFPYVASYFGQFFAGFAALGLDLDVNKNEQIFDQLLELDPEDVIAKVIRL